MIIIHAVQKLLNTSRLPATAYVTKAADGQQMHSWYARLFSSTFPGKLMVMYVHEPSLLTIVCLGKTIKGTWPQFQERLPALLHRFKFPENFLENEMKEFNDYVVAKTNSKSMLAHMNQMIFQLEFDCSRFQDYESISQDFLEDRMMDHLYSCKEMKNKFTTPQRFWTFVTGDDERFLY